MAKDHPPRDLGDRWCRVGDAVAGVREVLGAAGTADDRAGETVAGAVAANVLPVHSERQLTGLELAVWLV